VIIKSKILFILGLFVFWINTTFGQSAKYDILLDLDKIKQTCNIIVDVKLLENKFKKSDTIWFHLPFNAYSNKYNTFTDELRRIFPESNYFFRKENQMSRMTDLSIKSEGNTIPHFFKNELEIEFVGVISDGQDLSFSYILKLPELVNGLGYYKGNYFLRHFYPQLAIQNNQWSFEGTRSYMPKKMHKAAINLQLNKLSDFELYTNGIIQADANKYLIKSEGTRDFYINLIELNAPFPKHEGSFMSGDRQVSYSIIHLGKPDKNRWMMVNANFNKATQFLNTHLGNYPHDHLHLMISENCIQCFEGESLAVTKDFDDDDEINLENYFVSSLASLWVFNNLNVSFDKYYWMPMGLSQYIEHENYKINFGQDSIHKNDEFLWGLDEKVHQYRKQKQLLPLMTDEMKLSSKQSFLNRFVQSRDFFRYAVKLAGKDAFDQTILAFQNDQEKFNLENFISKLESMSGKYIKTALTTYAQSAQYPDYTITKATPNGKDINIDFENIGEVSLTFPLNIVFKNGRVEEKIMDGFLGSNSVTIPNVNLDLVKTLSIDKDGVMPDENRENNHYFPKSDSNFKLKSTSIFGDNRSDRKELHGMLYPAYNSNDAFMAGAVFSNSSSEAYKKFRYAISPMYSFRNKALVGQAWAEYDKYLKSEVFDIMTFRAGVKSFHMNYVKKKTAQINFEYAQRYIKIDPTITLRFNVPEVLGKTATLSLRSLIIFEEMANFVQSGAFTGKSTGRSHIHQLMYNSKVEKATNRFDLNVVAEQQSYGNENYFKLTGSSILEWKYQRHREITFRAFIGGFLMNTQRKSGSFQNIFSRGSLALIHQGFNDYTYDEYFFSRQNQSQLQDDQVSMTNGGGFKTPIGSAYAMGMSNDFATSINVSAHLPFASKIFPIKAYFDMGTFTTFSDDKRVNNLMYNAGFMLNYADVFTINVPLIFSTDLGNAYKSEHKNFFSRISFGLNLHMFSFWKENIE
jgi:hypothetical protein